MLAGVAFAHAMRAFRWVRAHYELIKIASGSTLIVLGLLLFFNRDWWLRVALDELLGEGRARHVLAPQLVLDASGGVIVGRHGDDPARRGRLFLRGKLEGAASPATTVSAEGVDPPDLVIADVARIDPDDVADTFPDVPLLGFTNHKDTEGCAARTPPASTA